MTKYCFKYNYILNTTFNIFPLFFMLYERTIKLFDDSMKHATKCLFTVFSNIK